MKVIYAPLIHKNSKVDVSPCLIASVIELPVSQYRYFSENVFAEHDFIRDCEEPLHRTEYLYMPCDEYSIHKAAMRLGAAVEDCEASLYDFATDDQQWFDRLKRILSEEGIVAVNWVTEVLNDCELDLDDLEYVMQYAGREDCGAIVALTTHMEDFIVVPGICEDNEVAEYFLDNVYSCDLPEEMEAYLDMCDFGSYLMKQRNGRWMMRNAADSKAWKTR